MAGSIENRLQIRQPTKANIARRIGSGSEGQAAMILAKSGPSVVPLLSSLTTVSILGDNSNAGGHYPRGAGVGGKDPRRKRKN